MTKITLGAKIRGEKKIGGFTFDIDANAGNLDALEGECGICAKLIEWFDEPGKRMHNTVRALAILAKNATEEEIMEHIRPAEMLPAQLAVFAEIKEAFSHKEELEEDGEPVDVGLAEIEAKKTTP